MQLWLTPRTQPDHRVPPPAACPRAGCSGRRFRLHQAVAKPVRGVTPQTVVPAHRYTCQTCRRTFRAYPRGIDRGKVAVNVKQFAAALRLLGLSFRDISRTLTVLGAPLRKSQAQAVVAPKLTGLRHRSIAMAPLLSRVTIDDSHDDQPAHVWIHGRPLTLRRAIDRDGRAALVIDDVDRQTRYAVEQWIRPTLAGFGVEARIAFPASASRSAADARDAAGDVDPAAGNGASADPIDTAVAGADAPDAPDMPGVDHPASSDPTPDPADAASFASTTATPPAAPMRPCTPTLTRCAQWRLRPARPRLPAPKVPSPTHPTNNPSAADAWPPALRRASVFNPSPENHGQSLSKGSWHTTAKRVPPVIGSQGANPPPRTGHSPQHPHRIRRR